MPGPNKTYEDVDASELIAQYLSSPGASQEFEIGVDVPATTFDGNPSSLNQEGATSGEVLGWDGAQWSPTTDATGGGDLYTVVSNASNLQTELNNAAGETGVGPEGKRLTVACASGLTIDTGSTITVPPGVHLDASNATFEPSTDYDGFFLDNGSRIKIRALTDETYTSRIVYLDTTESTDGKYTGDTTQTGSYYNRGAEFEVEHVNTGSAPVNETDGGVSVELNDSAALGIGTDVTGTIKSYNAGVCLKAVAASGGYVNPIIQYLSSTWCHTGIKTEGPGDGNLIAYGEIQGGLGAEYGINNPDAGGTPQFGGFLWDPSTYDSFSLAGSVRVNSAEPARLFIGTTDGSDFQTVYCDGLPRGWAMYSGASDTAIRYEMDAVGDIEYSLNTGGGTVRSQNSNRTLATYCLQGPSVIIRPSRRTQYARHSQLSHRHE